MLFFKIFKVSQMHNFTLNLEVIKKKNFKKPFLPPLSIETLMKLT